MNFFCYYQRSSASQAPIIPAAHSFTVICSLAEVGSDYFGRAFASHLYSAKRFPDGDEFRLISQFRCGKIATGRCFWSRHVRASINCALSCCISSGGYILLCICLFLYRLVHRSVSCYCKFFTFTK
uniref:Golgi apparatus membrane protein TVP23 homolog n=1 Tax=Parascaris univalens TaxID=6257 RepID=A0A914ZR98_PARUN